MTELKLFQENECDGVKSIESIKSDLIARRKELGKQEKLVEKHSEISDSESMTEKRARETDCIIAKQCVAQLLIEIEGIERGLLGRWMPEKENGE